MSVVKGSVSMVEAYAIMHMPMVAYARGTPLPDE